MLVVWLLLSIWLICLPSADLTQATGLYPPEGREPFRWTTSEVALPLRPNTGPTVVQLTLQTEYWPGREQATPLTFVLPEQTITISITNQPRRFDLLLPSGSDEFMLQTPLSRPPGAETRWLGVKLLSLAATPSGWPLLAVWHALLGALALGGLFWMFYWLAQRRLAAIGAVLLLGAGVRLYGLTGSPPGMHRDEMVSLVDAWHLLHTARDHHGQWLPLAAFEAYGDWISPLLAYLHLPAVALLGPTPLAARLTTALIGTLLPLVLYHLARKLDLPHWAALLTALAAALSPWSVFLSRIAIPPALAPTGYALVLLAALHLLQTATRRAAWWLAVAAGLALSSYPTMKLAVPLLTGVAVLVALQAHGWQRMRHWVWPGVGLAVLWLPFLLDTLLNPASSARFSQIGLQAASLSDWLAKWWENYRVYFGPDLYYLSGDTRKIVRGVPGFGVALPIEAPFVLVGCVTLLWNALRRRELSAWLLIAALAIAPLGASLTERGLNTYRAAPMVVPYLLLVGLGLANVGRWLQQRAERWWARWSPMLAATLIVLMVWQAGSWWQALLIEYPRRAALTWFFADQLTNVMERVVADATNFDQIWLDTDSIGRPYIYLLAARPMPPAMSQALMEVERRPPEPHFVTRIGKYRFADLETAAVPVDLPVRTLILEQVGGNGYLLQEWQRDQQRILVVRGTGDLPDDEEP
jgi:hypothetical protein